MDDIKRGYDRITTILGHFSGYDHVPDFVLQKAKDRGTAVHKMFEDMSTGKEPEEFNPAYKGYYDSLSKWMEGKHFLFPLDRLYNEHYMITGMIDGIYEDEEGLNLFDLKTSASIGKTWTEQMGGYLTLLNGTKITIDNVEIIQIKKDGEFPDIIPICSNYNLTSINNTECQVRFLDCWVIFDRFFRKKDSIDIEKL